MWATCEAMGGPKGASGTFQTKRAASKQDPHGGQVPSAQGIESQCLPENRSLCGHPYSQTHGPVSSFDGLQGKGMGMGLRSLGRREMKVSWPGKCTMGQTLQISVSVSNMMARGVTQWWWREPPGGQLCGQGRRTAHSDWKTRIVSLKLVNRMVTGPRL